jgi:hypothetical protein
MEGETLMSLLWYGPSSWVSGDPTLKIDPPWSGHPWTRVSCTSPGDFKWVTMSLLLPYQAVVHEVIVCYQLQSSSSFISQVRLVEMTTPDVAYVKHDDPTDLKSTTPASYTSVVDAFVPMAALTVELRLEFQSTADSIALGAVGLRMSASGCLTGVTELTATGDETDRTTDLQTALDDGGIVYLGPGLYIISNHIDIKSNTRLHLHPHAIIRRSLNTPAQTQMIRLINVYNVIVEGGVIDGNKQSPVPGVGGQCSGLTFSGSHDVVIRDVEIKNFPEDATDPITGDQHGSYGDGIYIGSGGETGYAYRVRISNVYSHGHERHGLFIVAGKDIVVENSVFSDTTGDEPGSAVNLETGDAGVFSAEAMQNITFRNCIMETSLLGLTANNHSSSYWHDILFDGCVFRNNRAGGAATGGAALPQNNFRFVNCISENNRGGPGFYSGGSVGIQFIGCRSEGNVGGHGFELYEAKDFVLRDCSGYTNDGAGVYIRKDADLPMYGLIEGCRLFNNNDRGISIQSSVPLGSSVIGLHIAHCRTGNLNLLAPRPWVAGRNVLPDVRVLKDGRIYECVTAGTCATVALSFDAQVASFTNNLVVTGGTSRATGYIISQTVVGTVGTLQLGAVNGTFVDNEALTDSDGGSATVNGPPSSPGPTGTGPDITDGTSHWKYIMDIPTQAWGMEFYGECTRGVTVTRCFDHGNSEGHIREWPAADANALFTTDVLGSQWDGQQGSPLTRSRFVAFEDRSGTPGPRPSYYAAGKNAIAAGASFVIIGTPFAKAEDIVMITPMSLDTTLTRFKVECSDGQFTLTGNAPATLAWIFAWEVIKKGTFKYDLPMLP